MTKNEFEDCIFGTFEAITCDGENVELIPNGSQIELNWENRFNYINCLQNFKLNEFNLQVEAIRKGIDSIVSMDIFKLFSWREFEYYVCGVQVSI
jgi:hypothetical protein